MLSHSLRTCMGRLVSDDQVGGAYNVVNINVGTKSPYKVLASNARLL